MNKSVCERFNAKRSYIKRALNGFLAILGVKPDRYSLRAEYASMLQSRATVRYPEDPDGAERAEEEEIPEADGETEKRAQTGESAPPTRLPGVGLTTRMCETTLRAR